jgi:hypothetical protein
MTAELLKDVLPIGSTADASTVRRHLHKVAARHDADLGSKQLGGLDGGPGNGQPIANNAAAIVNYSRRWDNGERISTAFVESAVNLVISRRFTRKQQMQWSKVGAYRLLQTRTKTLDGTLRDLFTPWYPDMVVNDNQVPALARAA